MPNIQCLKKVYDLNWYPTRRSYLITLNWGVSRFKNVPCNHFSRAAGLAELQAVYLEQTWKIFRLGRSESLSML